MRSQNSVWFRARGSWNYRMGAGPARPDRMPPESPDEERVPRVFPATRGRGGFAPGDHLPLRLREVRRHPAPRRGVPARRQGGADRRKRLRLPGGSYRESARHPVRGQGARAAGDLFPRSLLACWEKGSQGWIELLCSKYVLSMPPQRRCIGPERSSSRANDTASFEVGQVTREVIQGGEL